MITSDVLPRGNVAAVLSFMGWGAHLRSRPALKVPFLLAVSTTASTALFASSSASAARHA